MILTYKNAPIYDLSAIVEIYNSTVASGMVTADTEPVTIKSKVEWYKEHNPLTRPLWMVKNENREIVGWVSFQSFYGRPAYEATAELSIYLAESFRGQGLGKTILNHCLQTAPSLGIKTLLGFIFQHNIPSLKLFHSAGFSDWGTLPDVAVINNENCSLIITGKKV